MDIGFATFHDSKLSWKIELALSLLKTPLCVVLIDLMHAGAHKAGSLKFLVLKYNSGT